MTLRVLPCLFACVLAAGARAGEFERLNGSRLERLAGGEGGTARPRLTAREIEALPEALRDERFALLAVRTSQGNLARLLVSSGLRKGTGPGSEAAPRAVLVVEKFATFEPGKAGTRVASGAGLTLFDGFRFDLDLGQVVPEGFGADLTFEARGDGGGTLVALEPARLFTPQVPLPPAPTEAGPSAGRAVVPGDFAGRYRLQADGRWSGLLELTVSPDRRVAGHFRSEPGGHSYPVSGQVAADVPHKLTFYVKFPRSEQDYEGFLATEGKGSLAGTFTMAGRTFGFSAQREVEKAPAAP